MNGTRAYIVVVAIFVAVLIYVWRVNHRPKMRRLPRHLDPDRRLRLSELLGDRHDIGTWPGVPPLADPENDRQSEPAHGPVTHLLPPEGDGEFVTPCCGRSPFDLNASREPLTIRPENVTCGGGS